MAVFFLAERKDMLMRGRSNEHINIPIEPSWIDIIDPEIPESSGEKLELLNRCLAAIALGARVEKVTPKHVGSEGMYLVQRALKAQARRHEV